MFRNLYGNMFSDSSDDYLTAMGMYILFGGNNVNTSRFEDVLKGHYGCETNIKIIRERKLTEEGKRFFDQMKEEAEDIEYEEIRD